MHLLPGARRGPPPAARTSASAPPGTRAAAFLAALLIALAVAPGLAGSPSEPSDPDPALHREASDSGPGGKPAVGRPAPDFRLESLAKPRSATTLKDLSGQVVLLDFWASWCGPCKRTLPELARLGARHGGLKVLAVSVDEDRAKAAGFLKRGDAGRGLEALHDSRREVAARYDLAGMPSAVLIDRKGVLRARWDGYTERDLARMEAEVRKLLEEKP